jgi:hypothetical protein
MGQVDQAAGGEGVGGEEERKLVVDPRLRDWQARQFGGAHQQDQQGAGEGGQRLAARPFGAEALNGGEEWRDAHGRRGTGHSIFQISNTFASPFDQTQGR